MSKDPVRRQRKFAMCPRIDRRLDVPSCQPLRSFRVRAPRPDDGSVFERVNWSAVSCQHRPFFDFCAATPVVAVRCQCVADLDLGLRQQQDQPKRTTRLQPQKCVRLNFMVTSSNLVDVLSKPTKTDKMQPRWYPRNAALACGIFLNNFTSSGT